MVQIDEMMHYQAFKNHRVQGHREQIWCLSIADTSYSPLKLYFEIVRSRHAREHIFIISRIVKNGSIIATNEFKSCNLLHTMMILNIERCVISIILFVQLLSTYSACLNSNNILKLAIKKAIRLTDKKRKLIKLE